MTQPDASPPPRRAQLLRAARWVVAVLAMGLFGWLLAQQDWQEITQAVRGIPPWVLVAMWLLYFSGHLCNAWRWLVLLHARQVVFTYWQSLQIGLAGSFAANFLPTTIGGDALRTVAVTRHTHSLSLSLSSIIVDRALNLLAMLTTLPFVFVTFGSQVTLMAPFGAVVLQPVQRMWGKLKTALTGWLTQPTVLAGAIGISWLSVLVVFLAGWLLALHLGVSLSLVQIIGVISLGYFAAIIPISVNGLGVRELVIVTLLTQLGATTVQGATFALITRLIMLLSTTPGAWWLPGLLAQTAPDNRV